MNVDQYKTNFINSVEEWLCDSYSLDFRYVAKRDGEQLILLAAALGLSPIPPDTDLNFHVETSQVSAGQYQLNKLPRRQIISLLKNAADGHLDIEGRSFKLANDQPLYRYYSETVNRESWFNQLHLKISGSQPTAYSANDILKIDNDLRRGVPPFDGVTDLVAWLGLPDPYITSQPYSIDIRIAPPVDIIITDSALKDDQLLLTLVAHPWFDVSRVSLAVRAFPGIGVKMRKQISSTIKWKRAKSNRKVGHAKAKLSHADSALAILMVSESTIRRQWFLDPVKARNSRFVALNTFDNDLRMIKKVVLTPSDSTRFEIGIAALLFLLGFTPAISIETDSPDLVVVSPAGAIVIIECTTKVGDFQAKLGKLVSRRVLLENTMSESAHLNRVDAFLICGSRRDRIANPDAAAQERVTLVTQEDLALLLDRVRLPSNPDELLDAARSLLKPKDQFSSRRAQ